MNRIIEGVPYSKYRARWREAGKRKQVTFWLVGSEVSRMLADRDVPAHTRVLIQAL